MAYTLDLTAEDFDAIDFARGRYGWATALWENCEEGRNEIPENVAWELQEAFESDTEGNHSYFPCLDGQSDLAEKLYTFMLAIV